MAKAYGIQAVVHKTRTLICAGRTRIHFDNVGDLGDFIELEVVLKDGDSLLDAEKEVLQIMQHLEITEDALVKEAYVDLLSNSYSEPPIKHRQASK